MHLTGQLAGNRGNREWRHDGHQTRRVDQTSQSWQAWLTLARDPYFGGHGS